MQVTLADGRKFLVDFRVTQYGSETTYSPRYGADGGDAMEIEIDEILTLDGTPVALSDEDREAVEAYICENFVPDYDDDY